MSTNGLGHIVPIGEPKQREIADGIVETRRKMLLFPLAAAALLLIRPTSAFGQKAEAASSSTWDGFLAECLPKAVGLHADSTRQGQEKYLRWLGYNAAKLKLGDLPTAKLGKFKNLDPAMFFGVGYRGIPFFVVEWRMEPNAFLPPHNHPNVSVCTVGLEGEARMRNFEPVAEMPAFSSARTFQIQETHNEVLRPGQINTLSAVRDNIHTFQAGRNGARGIDITTYHGENIGFSHLEIVDKTGTADRIFEAKWTKL
ncbi:MAG: hypothetical protein WBO10_01495 [Pyrinomonadaceae bacterium]